MSLTDVAGGYDVVYRWYDYLKRERNYFQCGRFLLKAWGGLRQDAGVFFSEHTSF